VTIEQAIGVLAQRFAVAPREAFDRLRKSARSRGQRVHELAVSIVRSARDESVVLPADLT
jgi:AmiR/NasT family two-component response regulator